MLSTQLSSITWALQDRMKNEGEIKRIIKKSRATFLERNRFSLPRFRR
jgi:hypothetical protein